MQFVLKNCEILHFVRGLYDKRLIVLFLLRCGVYIKKRMVCTPPDLLARICKLVERKKIRPDLFSKNLFSTPYATT